MISIITVARNAAETIPDCLASVAAQSVRPEHVIVDGASTDGTVEIVRGWTGHPVREFSGPDRGMYDAMNKGSRWGQISIFDIWNGTRGPVNA
jgi:glycosyltransferase involved in cell wall biosynthesis